MSKIQFRNAAHRDFVLENLDKCKVNDCYHRAFFYVMGISEETRMNIGKMFDFKRDCIIPEGMHGGVAMIDVNQFKSVNDSFGHLVGDEALQTVAAAMQSCLRQTDILIRYGGDEFLLLMPQNCPDGVESVIRRVQNAVQAARVPSHPELRLSVSIGGVCNVQPLTEAIRQADARMYCNKENGEPVL